MFGPAGSWTASTRRLPVVDVATRRLTGEEEWLMGDKRGGGGGGGLLL